MTFLLIAFDSLLNIQNKTEHKNVLNMFIIYIITRIQIFQNKYVETNIQFSQCVFKYYEKNVTAGVCTYVI